MKNEDLMGFIGGLLPMVIMANGWWDNYI
jgi:hypothetical protein